MAIENNPIEQPGDNPGWTSAQNRTFDQNSTFKSTGEARQDAMALGDEVGARAIEAAKKTVKPVHGSIQREIADSDARIQPAIEQTTGGAEILDMDPEKKAADLEEIRKIQESLGGNKVT